MDIANPGKSFGFDIIEPQHRSGHHTISREPSLHPKLNSFLKGSLIFNLIRELAAQTKTIQIPDPRSQFFWWDHSKKFEFISILILILKIFKKSEEDNDNLMDYYGEPSTGLLVSISTY